MLATASISIVLEDTIFDENNDNHHLEYRKKIIKQTLHRIRISRDFVLFS